MIHQNKAQIEAIDVANAHLTDAGLPSYDDLLNLIDEAQALGLTFYIGNAYIRRSYIDAQTKLNNQIAAIPR
jgi:hypothetical protein